MAKIPEAENRLLRDAGNVQSHDDAAGKEAWPMMNKEQTEGKQGHTVNDGCSGSSLVDITAKERTGCKEQRGSSRKSVYEKMSATAGNLELMPVGFDTTKNDVAVEYRAVESSIRSEEKGRREKGDGSDPITEKENDVDKGAKHQKHVATEKPSEVSTVAEVSSKEAKSVVSKANDLIGLAERRCR